MGIRVRGAAVMAAGLFVLGAGAPAQAACTAPCSEFTTAGEQVFTVPAGVRSITVTAIGGKGGRTYSDAGTSPGGWGGRVAGTLAVTPGQTFYATVAKNGRDGTDRLEYGGGGEASDLRTCSATDTLCGGLGSMSDPRLLVAAGGGASGRAVLFQGVIIYGGNGGNAGAAGLSGQNLRYLPAGGGGGAGTQTAGGAGGTAWRGFSVLAGQPGTAGRGGSGGGGIYEGGNGGDGWYGGGGGSGGTIYSADGYTTDDAASGAGGGGGSSRVASTLTGASTAVDSTGVPSVTISWTSPAPDRTAPQTTINSGTSGPISTNSASFTFSSSEPGSTFSCRLDGPGSAIGTAGPCTSSKLYSALADGTYTFRVAATDAAGNTDSTPDTRTFTVDRVAPDTTLTTGPPTTTNSTTVTFAFTSSETGSTFTCTLDGSASSCSSPKSYTGLADGSHTFSVAAKDAAGNSDPTPASQTFTVDTTPPQTTIDFGPAATINTTSASFTFTSETGASFTCTLDGSTSSCSSPKSYTGLADGTHTFSVTAKDAAGNSDPTPATRTFTVDTTPPDTTLTGGPTGTITTDSASFTFSSETGASFTCRLDGPGSTTGTAGACTSPKSYTGLTNGTYTFTVTARDSAGNSDPSPATRSFTVAVSRPPVVSTTAPDANGSEGQTLTTAGAFSDPDGDALTLTASPSAGFVPGTGGAWTWSRATTDNGSGSVTVTATDPSGKSVADTFAWTAVNAKPVLSALSDTGPSCTPTLAFTFSDPGTADTHTGTVTWGDGTSSIFTTSPFSVGHSYPDAGARTITATVTDDDGGTDQKTLQHTVFNVPTAILQPSAGSSATIGLDILVVIRIRDCSGRYVRTLAPQVRLTPEGQSPATAADATMRYDDGNERYLAQVPTGGRPAGSYVISITDPSLAAPVTTTITLAAPSNTVPLPTGA